MNRSSHCKGRIVKLIALAGMALMVSLGAQAATLDGKALFAQNCAACHGDTGKGGTGDVKGPKLVGDATNWSHKLFRRAVLEGKDDEGKALDPAMPHWKDASFQADKGKAPTPAEVAAIYRYLRTLK
jgi:mono/diheme cytochrome c family protein